ncbi:methyl-accepting chemotaxis protein [Leptospira sp. 201903071]|uniref:methyl-accepting chemotaxis protein n=1 Tax=Leptospira ainazelensis TaxID=2810034 RepID=UPI0019629A6F|nr:methyl-accepting chemotaxis protein [Leptospira ainazelensis]MBM9498682.1 methyl-accepting chemotaxis protein [Leptospira ainazelensis]
MLSRDSKTQWTDRDIIASGPAYINWIRLILIVLFYVSITASWKRSTVTQNTFYLLGVTSMLVYALYSLYKIKVYGKISERQSQLFMILDVLSLFSTMIVVAADIPQNSGVIVKGQIFYGISYLYIICAGLLLSPNFVLVIGLLTSVTQSIIIAVAVQYGLQMVDDPVLAASASYASMSEQIMKIIFLFTASLIVRFLVSLFLKLVQNSELRQKELEHSQKIMNDKTTKMRESARSLRNSSQNLKDFMKDFTQVVSDHASSFEEISSTMEEFQSQTESSAETVQNQFQNIENLVVHSQNLKSIIEKITSFNQHLDRSLEKLRTAGSTVNGFVQELSHSLFALGDSFRSVSDVNQIMSDVADRTNLLSLNASIEAARAGNAGKGFAVVAQEVSKLAESSAKNADLISNIIKKSTNHVSSGQKSAEITAERFKEQDSLFHEFVSHFEEFTRLFREQNSINSQFFSNLDFLKALSSEIELASKEQRVGLRAIVNSINDLQTSMESLTAKSENLSGIILELDVQSGELTNKD